MKTILLLHDEATQPTQLLRNALPAKVPSAKPKLSPVATATAGVIRVQAVPSALLNRHRSFRFQYRRRNEVKHGIPNSI